MADSDQRSLLDPVIRFCLDQKLVVFLALAALVGAGVLFAPFDWKIPGVDRDPVPVDAIPDIGENQQIVFSEWPGRSPRDVEDQVTYPLTVALLGVPEVKTVRSFSMFGFSSIYVIFAEGADFYWSRSRVLERLASLRRDELPEGVSPRLGPDATALGQVFWYTLEGRDEQGNPTGGWDLEELRSIQDWQVRYELLAAKGVAEVASVGGFVREYQVDVDPDALLTHGVTIGQVFQAVRDSNRDIGARTIEVNRVEYVIRGLGFIRDLADLENAVVKLTDNVPIRVRDVARVSRGPALRRGALDREGAEVVGGVVVVRFGENPLAAIEAVREKIEDLAPALDTKTLPDGRVSRVTIVPFYDRTGLIHETLDTLETALVGEILVTIIVVVIMVWHLRASLLVSGLLPVAVLMTFIAMKIFGVDANIVALSGIAIAIGTMVDMGIVICENILRHRREAPPDTDSRTVVFQATREVGGAVITAVATTVVGFLPVFTMIGQEGKLFRPLAFTKTFALVASVLVAVLVLPPLAHLLFGRRRKPETPEPATAPGSSGLSRLANAAAILLVAWLLARHWRPLGPDRTLGLNLIFVTLVIGGLLAGFYLFYRLFPALLGWCLRHKPAFLALPLAAVALAAAVMLNLGREFMPPLDEGSFLFMPTTMTHASIGEALDVLQRQDRAISMIPEVQSAVGKIGRAESPLDPAPISMIETVINYHAEYYADEEGHRRFRFEAAGRDFFRDPAGEPQPAPDGEPYYLAGRFARDPETNALIPDPNGRPFRVWRPALDPALNEGREAWPGIRTPDDIWEEIGRAAAVPGSTGAPRLQPIAARLVMLQSGMRAPLGIKIKGDDLETIERVGLDIERLLQSGDIPGVKTTAVIADRIVGKPYLEITPDDEAMAFYGLNPEDLNRVLETAIGGRRVTTTVEKRKRYPVRVRYLRERRDTIEDLERILVPAADGTRVPLGQLADFRYVRGPQMIKSEDTRLTGYVLFDRLPGHAEVDVAEAVKSFLARHPELNRDGVTWELAGAYENQQRATRTLRIILPLALLVIFIILYLQFRSALYAVLVFSGIFVAASGGFLLLWLYGQEWFLNFSLFGANLRELFQVHPINLSVAVWVGFLALFGIASDDGVLVLTYLEQSFARRRPSTRDEIRQAVIAAARRRIRPALMTSATTILALLPVLTATGRGSDIMVPMAIPTFGGMLLALLTVLVVPVLYSFFKELRALPAEPRA